MSESDYPCDLCGAADAVAIPEVLEYTGDQPIHVCQRCGLVYVKRRRSPSEVAAYWSETMLGVHYTARIPALKARHVFIAETIDVTLGLRGKRVCDIGTGEGQFLEIVRHPEYGALAFGTEASPTYCAALVKSGISCFCGTAEDFLESGELEGYRADVVTLIWTLESSTSCRTLLAAARRILETGGHLVVATGSRIMVPFKKPLHLYLEPKPLDIQPLRFSANTLRAMLAVNGFETVATNRFVDHDVLCVIARKREPGASIPWQGDDPAAVADFFARWHRETKFHSPGSTER